MTPETPVITLTAASLGRRFLGLRERPGAASEPAVLAMLQLDASWVSGDDTAWCSAFVNAICWALHLERSRSLRARSWLTVGRPVPLEDAREGFDVAVLSRGSNLAHGHVGFYVGHSTQMIQLLGGNQADQVSIASFERARLLGIRRVRQEATR